MALRSGMVSCRGEQGQSGPRVGRGSARAHLRLWALQSKPRPEPPSLRVPGAKVKGYPCPLAERVPMTTDPLLLHQAQPPGAGTLLRLCLYLSGDPG